MRSLLLALVVLGSVTFAACVGDAPAGSSDSGPDSPSAGQDATTDAPPSDAGVVIDTGSDAEAGVVKLPVATPPKLWLRADIGVSKGPQWVWADQSPNKLDAVSLPDAGPNGIPTRPSNYFPNGMPAVVFATEPQILQLPDAPAFNDFTNGISIFVVAIPTASSAGAWLNLGNPQGVNRIGFGQGAAQFFVATGLDIKAAVGANGACPANQAHLFEATIDAQKTISFYRDGQTAGTATATNAPGSVVRVPNTVGGGIGVTIATVPAALGEIVVYAKVVTPGERTDLEAYFKARWGTP